MAFRIVGTMNMYPMRSSCMRSSRPSGSNFSTITLRPPASQIGVKR